MAFLLNTSYPPIKRQKLSAGLKADKISSTSQARQESELAIQFTKRSAETNSA